MCGLGGGMTFSFWFELLGQVPRGVWVGNVTGIIRLGLAGACVEGAVMRRGVSEPN